jgi:hypothetical protein
MTIITKMCIGRTCSGIIRYSPVMQLRFILLMMVLCGGVCQSAAQENARTNERVRMLVDQLGDDSWLERDLATLELANFAEDISLDELEHSLADMTLTLEQRSRLELACTLRFLGHPKGGLGVAFGAIRVGAIEVQPIQNDPRFPASAMLNMGDEIAMVDGVMMNDSTDLRVQILSREPGQTLPVTVIRNSQLIQMELPLGSFGELAGAARLDPVVLRRTLEQRWKRKGISVEGPDVIGSAIDQDSWIHAAFPAGATPDVQTPSRRFSTTMIADAHRLIESGMPRATRRFKPWVSPEFIHQRGRDLRLKMAVQNRGQINARVELYTQEAKQLNLDLISDEKGSESQLIQHKIDLIRAELESLNAQGNVLDALIAEINAAILEGITPEP